MTYSEHKPTLHLHGPVAAARQDLGAVGAPHIRVWAAEEIALKDGARRKPGTVRLPVTLASTGPSRNDTAG